MTIESWRRPLVLNLLTFYYTGPLSGKKFYRTDQLFEDLQLVSGDRLPGPLEPVHRVALQAADDRLQR